MEKKIARRVVIKTIEEEVETTMFETKDGIVFDNEEEALMHEEEIDFSSYFEDRYKLKNIESFEYGLNYGACAYCHLVFIKKLTDDNISDFIRYYKLKDHPEDIGKLMTGWSFIALVSDANMWIFDQTDRKFIVQGIDDVIKIKNNELSLLRELT